MTGLIWIFDNEPKDPKDLWEWPMAIYEGKLHRHAAYIICEQPYRPIYRISPLHSPLKVVIRKYEPVINGDKESHRMLFDPWFKSLRNAIEFVEDYVQKHPDWQPKIT